MVCIACIPAVTASPRTYDGAESLPISWNTQLDAYSPEIEMEIAGVWVMDERDNVLYEGVLQTPSYISRDMAQTYRGRILYRFGEPDNPFYNDDVEQHHWRILMQVRYEAHMVGTVYRAGIYTIDITEPALQYWNSAEDTSVTLDVRYTMPSPNHPFTITVSNAGTNLLTIEEWCEDGRVQLYPATPHIDINHVSTYSYGRLDWSGRLEETDASLVVDRIEIIEGDEFAEHRHFPEFTQGSTTNLSEWHNGRLEFAHRFDPWELENLRHVYVYLTYAHDGFTRNDIRLDLAQSFREVIARGETVVNIYIYYENARGNYPFMVHIHDITGLPVRLADFCDDVNQAPTVYV